MLLKPWTVVVTCVLGAAAAACSGGDDGSPSASINPDGDSQTPPTAGSKKLEAWLAHGDYKKWACETVEHPQMGVSPHGVNRICSNDLASGFTGGTKDERPIGTASVKELYDDNAQLVGYAVGVKVAATSAEGANWFWYERVPVDSAAPHDDKGVVADGFGSDGTPKSICVGCHAGAAVDAKHTVTGSSDFVYLQVKP